jgi:ribonucleoside-diphosphate reductase alpha chain
MLTTYKLGWKTSYYHNTYDYKTDESVEEEKVVTVEPKETTDDDSCDACAI